MNEMNDGEKNMYHTVMPSKQMIRVHLILGLPVCLSVCVSVYKHQQCL